MVICYDYNIPIVFFFELEVYKNWILWICVLGNKNRNNKTNVPVSIIFKVSSATNSIIIFLR